jgi:hypothetical protein
MLVSHDDFHLQHSGELREPLADDGRLFALVRIGTDRVHP